MDILGAAAAGGESLLTSAVNIWQADVNRDFQRDMANTAVQRQVKDMRAAGINPIMAARYGGAAVPNGSQAQATSARVAQTAIESDVARADIAAKMATAENQSSAAGVNRATERQLTGTYEVQLQKAWADLEYIKTQTSKTAVDRDTLEKMQLKIQAEIENIRRETTNSALDAGRLNAENEYYRKYGSSAIARERGGLPGVAVDVLEKLFGKKKTKEAEAPQGFGENR